MFSVFLLLLATLDVRRYFCETVLQYFYREVEKQLVLKQGKREKEIEIEREKQQYNGKRKKEEGKMHEWTEERSK